MKVEILIPTAQYANLKFTIEGTEKEIDKEIDRLWKKWYQYFDKKENINGANKELMILSDKTAKRVSDWETALQAEEDENLS